MELSQLERDWDRAVLQNDTAFIDRVLAREFTAVNPDGSKGDRQRLEVTYRYLDVFVRRDGRWQCIASQSLKVPA